MNEITFSVGVDVDSLWHYYRIHGLDEQQASDHAWSHGVPRFVELFESLNLPASFYCVAEDIERSKSCAQNLTVLSKKGFEIGNHSWRHPYSLTLLEPEQARLEIIEGKTRLEAASQSAVLGFRAPGYHTHAQLQAPLIDSGHLYESSAFPCIPYYLAKATVMGMMRLTGRRSQSILGSPSLLVAPKQPYIAQLQHPYRKAKQAQDQGLVHVPISVWRGLPLIGTLFALLGPKWSQYLGKTVIKQIKQNHLKAIRPFSHLTIEFHAADLLGLVEDELDPRLKVQPDLKRDLHSKRLAFEHFLLELKKEAKPIRLDQLATQLKHELSLPMLESSLNEKAP